MLNKDLRLLPKIRDRLSFLYLEHAKMDLAAPAAFRAVSGGILDIERRIRINCRDEFHSKGLLKNIVSDLHSLFGTQEPKADAPDDMEADSSLPGYLWSPGGNESPGGIAYGVDDEKKVD